MRITTDDNKYKNICFVEVVGEAMHTCDLKLAHTLVCRLAMRMGMMVCLCHDWVGGELSHTPPLACNLVVRNIRSLKLLL